MSALRSRSVTSVVALFAAHGLLHAQLSLDVPGVAVTEDFNIPGTSACTAPITWSDNSTIPNCYADRPVFYYSNGCANIGGLHVAGTNGEMAFGGRGSNSTAQVRWGVRFKNNTGVTLSALHLRARCEQWGQAQSNLTNNVTPFSYRTSSTPITDVTSGTYINNATWDLVSVTAPGSCGGGNTAIDGNANATWMEGCLNVTLAPGDEIMLRWWDTNDACNDHMLCVDDVSVTGIVGPAITGPESACAGVLVDLSASGGPGLLWSTGDTTATISVPPGTYTVTANSACGPLTATHTVTELPAAVAAIDPPGPASICSGGSLVLTASGGESYLWSTGSQDASITVNGPGTYVVTATTSCGSDQATITVTEQALPTAGIDPAGGELCPNSTMQLTASGGDGYLWSTSETTASIVISTAGTYSVSVTNACGTAEASVTIAPGHLPQATIDPAGPLMLCPGTTLDLEASGGTSYTWSTGSGQPGITVDAAGTYTVTAHNACGTDLASVVVNESPVEASFTASPQEGMAPLTVVFTNTSAPQDDVLWDLGDGSSTEASPTHTYTEEGTYPVLLTITNAQGCVDTATALIHVLPGEGWIEVPNVFSPDHDGVNDLFRVRYRALVRFNCLIFDRWGKQVGELDQADQGWNGRLNGEDLAAGVYFYVIQAQGVDGRVLDLHGDLTLLR